MRERQSQQFAGEGKKSKQVIDKVGMMGQVDGESQDEGTGCR